MSSRCAIQPGRYVAAKGRGPAQAAEAAASSALTVGRSCRRLSRLSYYPSGKWRGRNDIPLPDPRSLWATRGGDVAHQLHRILILPQHNPVITAAIARSTSLVPILWRRRVMAQGSSAAPACRSRSAGRSWRVHAAWRAVVGGCATSGAVSSPSRRLLRPRPSQSCDHHRGHSEAAPAAPAGGDGFFRRARAAA